MAKLKDGYYKQTAEAIGSDLHVLLAGGGSKALSDFATSTGVVTALGTSGNYVTWTKNGTANNLTVPYASTAGSLTNLGTNDNASSTATKRKIWFSYDDGVSGRPALSANLTFQTSTSTLFCQKFNGYLVGSSDSTYTLNPIELSTESLDDTYTPGKMYFAGGGNSVTNKPAGIDAFGLLNMRAASGWYGQLLLSSNQLTGLYYRADASSADRVWKKLLDSSNYTDYTVKKDGTGASGTWAINISGKASTVTIGTSAADAYRAIVVTNGSNGLYTAGADTGKPRYNYATGDVKAYSFTTDGGNFIGNLTGTATNATKLNNVGMFDGWDGIPYFSGGVMEAGRYIDFKFNKDAHTGGKDFSTRLECYGNTGNRLKLPTTAGTLARIEDLPSSLPANGGDADTVDGKHATDFAAASHGTHVTGTTFTSGNSDNGEHNANNITTNGHWYYTSNGPSTTIGASTTDGALYSQAYSADWVAQIAQDYRNGNLFTRGKNTGTWQAWRAVAYQEDTPWSGAPTSIADINTFVKANRSYIGSICLTNGTWYNLISCRHRNGSSDGNAYGMYFYSTLTNKGDLMWNKEYNGTWQGARTILDSSNYTAYFTDTNYYPTAFSWTGGTTAGPTGSLTGVGMSAVSFGAIPAASSTASGIITTGNQSFSGQKTFETFVFANYITPISDTTGCGIGTDAWRYHGGYFENLYTTYIYMCPRTYSGTLYLTGLKDAPSTTSTVDSKLYASSYVKVQNSASSSAAVYAPGGFYESSDERLKNLLKPVRVDLDELSKLRKVYYTWKNSSDLGIHLGIVAQDVQKLYPELVTVDSETGYLSLSYDKLSVIALEAIDTLYKSYKELKRRVDTLEKLITNKGIL